MALVRSGFETTTSATCGSSCATTASFLWTSKPAKRIIFSSAGARRGNRRPRATSGSRWGPGVGLVLETVFAGAANGQFDNYLFELGAQPGGSAGAARYDSGFKTQSLDRPAPK